MNFWNRHTPSTANHAYRAGCCKSRRIKHSQGHKKSRKANLSGFFVKSVYESGLANLVDVTGEVEHLVGEAPLVWNRLRRFPGTTDL